MNERSCRSFFSRFENGDFRLKEQPKVDCPRILISKSWKLLSQPNCSADLADSDYRLLRGLQNHSDGLRLTSEVEHELVSYFASKRKEFYKRGVYKLVDRWNKVLESNGGYVND